MTQQIDVPSGAGTLRSAIAPARPVAWWRRPWMIPLAVVILAALVYIWRHYISLDPADATVNLPADRPHKYPLVWLHILFGSTALVTVFLQVWPWLRRHHPAVHRVAGRVYVFGGVLPSAVLAAYLLPALFGPPLTGWLGRAFLEVGWVVFTAIGYRTARTRQWSRHRRFMLYSFALTMDGFSTRLVSFTMMQLGLPILNPVLLSIIAWQWVVTLALVHLWLTYVKPRELVRLPS